MDPIGDRHRPEIDVEFAAAVADIVSHSPTHVCQTDRQIMLRAAPQEPGTHGRLLRPTLMAGKGIRSHVVGSTRRMAECLRREFTGCIDAPGAIGTWAAAVEASPAFNGNHLVVYAGRPHLYHLGGLVPLLGCSHVTILLHFGPDASPSQQRTTPETEGLPREFLKRCRRPSSEPSHLHS